MATASDPGRAAWPRALHRPFFLLAAAYAALVVPLSLVAPPAAGWHARELLFGYALAVVAGFLVTRAPAPVAAGLLLAWAASRLAAAGALGSGIAAWVAGPLFALGLLAAAAPPLWRAAKRAENRVVPLVLCLIAAVDAAWWAGAAAAVPAVQQRAVLAMVDLLVLLITVVGGRALPAAVGGHLERHGRPRRDRARRAWELPLVAVLAAGLLADTAGAGRVAGALSLLAAALVAVRASFWQLGHARARTELWTLALGYLWLVPGLALKGAAQIFAPAAAPAALHALTIGVIGGVTLAMTARTALLRARRPLRGLRPVGVAALLVAAAAVLRLAYAAAPAAGAGLLLTAAAAWSAGFAILFVFLLRRTGRGRGSRTG